MPATHPYKGLHSPVYLPTEDVEAAVKHAQKLAVVVGAGIDEANPLEILAVAILHANGLIQTEQR